MGARTWRSQNIFEDCRVMTDRLRSEALFYAVRAAAAGRDRIAVGARGRMVEEGADFLVQFGADDVFEFAGVRIGF